MQHGDCPDGISPAPALFDVKFWGSSCADLIKLWQLCADIQHSGAGERLSVSLAGSKTEEESPTGDVLSCDTWRHDFCSILEEVSVAPKDSLLTLY